MSMSEWTFAGVKAYERAIRLYPKQKRLLEQKAKRKRDKLFNRFFGKKGG